MQDEQQTRAFLDNISQEAKARGSSIEALYAGSDRPIEFKKGDRKILMSPRNYFYAADIFYHFDYYFGNVLPDQVEGFGTVDYSKPRWHRLSNNGQPFFFSGFPEGWVEAQLYLDYLKPAAGEIVLDLGAYCGLSAVTFAGAVGREGRVISFEPDPQNWSALQANIRPEVYPQVTTVNQAVWGTPKSLLFSSESNMGSRVVPDPGWNRDTLVEVQGTTLQRIVEEHNLPRVDIVKMDIEGGEYDVIENSMDFIRQTGARWFIEVHADWTPGHAGEVNLPRIRRAMDRCNYMTIQVSRQPEEVFYDLFYAEPRA